MPLPPVAVVDVDGIPAYVADIHTTFTGTLIFGVGLRDETARTAGLAHLIEHLVMMRVGRVHINHNATTADETISFYAQGAPSAVADFLTRVGHAIMTLHDTTDADVTEQRRIISNELGDDDERPGRGHLVDRFGNRSVGLLDFGTPAHRSHTRDEAITFADTWLHAGNAALSFSGPVPEGFSIALPPARPVPARPEPTVIRRGQWVVNGPIPVALSLILSGDDKASTHIASTLLADALHDTLRTERHLIYSAQPMIAALSRDDRLIGYALDPRPEHILDAARAALEVVRSLAVEGPSDAAIAEQRERWNNADDDPSGQVDYVDNLAVSALRGRRARDDVSAPPSLDTATSESVRAVIAAALETVFVTMGDEIVAESAEQITEALDLPIAEDPDPLFTSLNKWELMRHYMADSTEIFSGRLFKGARGAELVVDTERVSLVDDGVFEVRYDDIVLASYSEKQRVWSLAATPGHILFVDLDTWRGGKKLHALLEERIPATVRCRVDVESAA